MTEHRDAEKYAELLAAIAEANRIRIIECLWDGSKNVTELATMLKLKIVNVSHHLGVLKAVGLVHQEKKGRFVEYSLHTDYFQSTARNTSLDLGWCQITIPRAK